MLLAKRLATLASCLKGAKLHVALDILARQFALGKFFDRTHEFGFLGSSVQGSLISAPRTRMTRPRPPMKYKNSI